LSRVFTDYISSLPADSDEPVSYPPPEVLERLAKILGAQMRRRGLWRQPPRFLGERFEAYASWDDDGAFDDLLWDCLLAVVFDPRYLRSLKPRADEAGGNVDGMIPRNVGHFLTGRQQEHDRCGRAAFVNLRRAAEIATAEGRLRALVDDDRRIHTETLLVLPDADASDTPEKLPDDAVRAWCADLVARLWKVRRSVQRELAARFDRLVEGGAVVRFGNLASPVTAAARRHCESMLDPELDEAWGQHAVRSRPDGVAALDKAVLRAIAVLDKPAKTRTRLERIWRRYVELVEQDPPAGDGGKRAPWKPPSGNTVRESLPVPVPKSTFKDDLILLQAIVRQIHQDPADDTSAALPGR